MISEYEKKNNVKFSNKRKRETADDEESDGILAENLSPKNLKLADEIFELADKTKEEFQIV